MSESAGWISVGVALIVWAASDHNLRCYQKTLLFFLGFSIIAYVIVRVFLDKFKGFLRHRLMHHSNGSSFVDRIRHDYMAGILGENFDWADAGKIIPDDVVNQQLKKLYPYLIYTGNEDGSFVVNVNYKIAPWHFRCELALAKIVGI